ncbi:MAG: hypothetical protein ACK550_18465 [Synechococcaceae cyanobacterium]|jgi:hypothetical protein
MARPRNTAGDPPDAVEATDAATGTAAEPSPSLAEVVVPAPAAARAAAPAPAETPRQLLVPPRHRLVHRQWCPNDGAGIDPR